MVLINNWIQRENHVYICILGLAFGYRLPSGLPQCFSEFNSLRECTAVRPLMHRFVSGQLVCEPLVSLLTEFKCE